MPRKQKPTLRTCFKKCWETSRVLSPKVPMARKTSFGSEQSRNSPKTQLKNIHLGELPFFGKLIRYVFVCKNPRKLPENPVIWDPTKSQSMAVNAQLQRSVSDNISGGKRSAALKPCRKLWRTAPCGFLEPKWEPYFEGTKNREG